MSNKHSHRRVAIFGDRIIFSFLRHPSLYTTFTVNRWVHFVAMLEDIDDAARLIPLGRKATGHPQVLFRKHLGDGIYITALSRKHIIDFHKHFAMYGEKIRSVFSRRNGISICMEDEWVYLLQNIIPDIHRYYPKFANALPQCGCLLYGDDDDDNNDVNNHLEGLHGLLSIWT